MRCILIPYSLFPMGASPKSCLTGWCVTGRAVPRLAMRRKMKASPSLTHPTQLTADRTSSSVRVAHMLTSRFPIPDSRFPIQHF
ncbi:MAG: hypothetical protein F6K55_32965 [Moorea sp. SIO4A3]|nr:hypothetical protein [Moorena sp. SIO4A3]